MCLRAWRIHPCHCPVLCEACAALRRVLNCWCAARPHIGYVQGINCIAAALLVMCEHSEDEAAVLLQLLVERLPADWYLDQLKGGRVESGALLLP